MIIDLDAERGRISLSTKQLEPEPGDMIKNRDLVYDKAEEMAAKYREQLLAKQQGATAATGASLEASEEEIPPAAELDEEIPPAAELDEEIPPAAELEEIPAATETEEEIPVAAELEEIPAATETEEEIPVAVEE
ncbi:hypothetical protein ANSO36C_25190 [Nostoc cf. commune SO-36]|uniref:30S ribosomal protein S1 n=1 Tax=Nostoc cf. commune SO-36 TaxID=449208 RepID=A0ABN6Q5M4_NOSCO|nr:hypothetical protein ANSO36C_25190 [Nostoc cf. commune SO-36]